MARSKTCRECRAEIPHAARKCMFCGSKQGIGFFGAIFAGIFIIFVYGLVVSSLPDTRGSSPVAAPSVNETPEQQIARLEAEAGERAAKERAAAEARAENEAWILCKQAIRMHATFPSSVDVSLLNSPETMVLGGGNFVVRIAYEAKNGIGNMIPQMARCEVGSGKLLNFSSYNR